jgi:hypothetical protein
MTSRIITIKNIPCKEKKRNNYQIKKIYSEVPEVFESKNTWPIFCDLDCYICTCPINSTPLFIPIYIDEQKIYRGSNPVICSPNCGIILCNNDTNSIDYLRELCYRIIGKKLGIINPSNDKIIITNYGGTISKERYSSNLRQNNEFFQAL